MGKNMEAPERIWADRTGVEGAVEIGCWADTVRYMGGVEYIRADIAAPSAPAEVEGLDDYDAGLLNDWGGGNTEWWMDYIRAEIGRANEFWREQSATTLTAQQAEIERLRGDRDAWRENAEALAKECEAIRGDCASWCSPAFAAYAKLQSGD